MIFLTSSVGSVADHLYENFLADKGFKTVLFIDTAAEAEEDGGGAWLQKDLKSLQDQGYQVDRYTVTGKTLEEVEQKIDAYDILYMCGGNPGYLLSKLRETGAFGLIVEKVKGGKPYIGTSAGSIICGPRLPDYFFEDVAGLEDATCFNLVNFTIVPHWGDRYFKERYVGERLERVYTDTQNPLLLLTDTQYVEVTEDGSCRVIAT